MLTKNKIKFIRSLASKKERYSHRKFIIEGEKGIAEALNSNLEIDEIIGLHSFQEKYNSDLFISASKKDLERVSSMSTAPGVIAVANFIDWGDIKTERGKYVVLDSLNDPGNLGTIIRIADWYDFNGVICSKNSVDVYNPKVVQSSMGSIFRVPVYYEDLPKMLKSSPMQSFAAVMEGENFNEIEYPENGFLVLGSESHGIAEELLAFTKNKITIPRYGKAESLNVSVAAGILCQKWIS